MDGIQIIQRNVKVETRRNVEKDELKDEGKEISSQQVHNYRPHNTMNCHRSMFENPDQNHADQHQQGKKTKEKIQEQEMKLLMKYKNPPKDEIQKREQGDYERVGPVFCQCKYAGKQNEHPENIDHDMHQTNVVEQGYDQKIVNTNQYKHRGKSLFVSPKVMM
jgi:hypothetical protein